MFSTWVAVGTVLLAGSGPVAAIELNIDDPVSIKNAAATVAFDMMQVYNGNLSGGIPGNLPQPYFWWECGGMFGSMINYWHFTGDTSYNKVVSDGMQFQVGPDSNFMPPNQTFDMGNDDQGFWGMTAMTAAETGFPDPPPDKPQWLALAQGVFNDLTGRWDTAICNGGLRWQVYPKPTFDYKNSVSNGALFNLASRLAMYSKTNTTFTDWAVKTWDWSVNVGNINKDFDVLDGTHVENNCTDHAKTFFSYNSGIWLLGAANMYNLTNGDPKWKARVEGLLGASKRFYASEVANIKNVMIEVQCENSTFSACNNDQLSFRGYFSRFLAATTIVAPFTTDQINPILRASAQAAAKQCSGGASGRVCGSRWIDLGVWDGSTGVGQQLSALEVFQSNLIGHIGLKKAAPLSNTTGGTSQGNSLAGSAGGGRGAYGMDPIYSPITVADRAGAGILTAIFLMLALAACSWLVT